MKRYEAYKPTETNWIPSVPITWDMKKIVHLFSQRKEKVSDRDFPPLSVTKNGILLQLDNAAKTDDGDNRKRVCVGDFVINSRSDRKGSCGVSTLEGSVSLINIVLQPRQQLTGNYAHYLLRSQPFSEEFYRNGRGIVADLWTTRYSEMKTILLPVPPREEQDQIVRYLDWQVSKINRLIAAKRKEIDAIHDMEHLYIDHVFSEIANQKTIRLKYLVEQFVDCPHETPEYCKDGDYCVIRTADQDYGCLRSETLMYRLTESEYTNRIRRAPLNAGDIVYGREGERWGLACVIPESEKFCLGQRIMQFVCNKQMVTPEYVMWALNSSYVRNQGILDTMGSTSPHVNISTIINFRIPYTSREHQDTLVSKIECTMQKYRQLCERIENEIQLLHDLRIRLISDVVTGQIDVRGIKVPDDEYINNEITEEEFEEESENNEEE
ncbi:MAG: restriction endonuclease subunit S [Christensenellales bacterium]